ncbi:HTH-type transcriptional regulator DmlR [compost metagenome]
MNLRTENIEAFLRVVELGSVSGAARHLNTSKSVVSKRLTDLEREMGARLLYRSTRMVQPTEVGRLFYDDARVAMHCLQQAAESAGQQAQGLRGELRVVAPSSLGALWLSDLAAEFAQKNAQIDLVFDLDDTVSDLDAKRYDLGIFVGRLRDSSFVARRLATSRRLLCCSPSHASKIRAPQSLDDLRRQASLASDRDRAAHGWMPDEDGSSSPMPGLPPRGRFRTNHEASLRGAIVQGLGLAVLPLYLVATDLQEGRLVEIRSETPPAADQIYAMYMRGASTSPKLKAFVAHLQRALEVPPWERPEGRYEVAASAANAASLVPA